MFYLKIKNLIDSDYFELAKKYFDKQYTNKFNNKVNKKESIVSRYLISKIIKKEFGINKYFPLIDYYIARKEDKFFFSISHKKDLVFVGVSYKKIGVDIEIFKKRDFSLLDIFPFENYNILGGKNWKSFYILWTSYESIIKYVGYNINTTENLLLEKTITLNKNLGGLFFSDCLYFSFDGELVKYKIYFGSKYSLYYSVCIN